MSLVSRYLLNASGGAGETYWYAAFDVDTAVASGSSSQAQNENLTTPYIADDGTIALGWDSNAASTFISLDKDANVNWSYFVDLGANHRFEKMRGAYIDASGNHYFCGEAYNGSDTNYQTYIAKLNSSGTLQYKKFTRPKTSGNYAAVSIVPASSTHLFVTDRYGNGLIRLSDGAFTAYSNEVKIGSNGVFGQNLNGRKACTDGTYVYQMGTWTNSSLGYREHGLARFTSSLANSNAYVFTQGFSDEADGRSCAMNDSSFVATTWTNAVSSNYYNGIQAGTLSTNNFAYRSNQNFGANPANYCEVDADNNVYWIHRGTGSSPGQTFLLKFNSSGTLQYKREFNANVVCTALKGEALYIWFYGDSSGNVKKMVKLPLDGSGTGTYGTTDTITYSVSTWSSYGSQTFTTGSSTNTENGFTFSAANFTPTTVDTANMVTQEEYEEIAV